MIDDAIIKIKFYNFFTTNSLLFCIGLRIITIILKCDIHNRTDIKEGEVYER